MMQELLAKYARLAVRSGVNLQPNQTLLLKASVEASAFARLVVKEAYAAGAKEVVVTYQDETITKEHFLHQSEATLKDIHDWEIESSLDYLREGACVMNIISPLPGIMKDCDPQKMNVRQQAMAALTKEMRNYTMASIVQWTIVAIPNPSWASLVFPHLEEEAAMAALWKEIFACVYVDDQKDPLDTWKKRDVQFANRVAKMNSFAFRRLHFTNNIGTNLYIGLVDHHLWGGGSEKSQAQISFNANIPTEEIFTMPHKEKVEGRVVASRPLLYNGNLIEDFYFTFKDGRVVDYDAKMGKDTLAQLLAFDQGSMRLGEVALVPHNSPISQSGILFYTTLFDENASCHLALGQAYPSCLKDGVNLSDDELLEHGCNISNVHVDFMFGTKDMNVLGELQDGTWLPVFENGNFVI